MSVWVSVWVPGGTLVGQRGVVDGLAHLGVVGPLQQSQVVDAGGLDGAGRLGFDGRVHVPGDLVRDRLAHRAALVLDLDEAQVERGEQCIDGATGQGGVYFVPVPVQGDGRERGDPALLAPQERPPQQSRIRPRDHRPAGGVVPLGRGGPDFGMLGAVVPLVQPGGEQAVQVGQRLTPGPVAGRGVDGGVDLDEELVAHGAIPPFDLAAPLRAAGRGVDQLDVQHRAGPGQLVGGVGRAVVGIQSLRAAVGLDRVVQRGLQAQGVLAVAPAVPDHVPGVIVQQREQHRPLALDDRAVQTVGDPQLVRLAGLEPAERLRRRPVRASTQLQAGEVALQGAGRGRPPLLGLDDPHDVGGGPGRAFPLQAYRQLQHRALGTRRDSPLGRDQRVEPAGPPRPDPAIQAGPRHRHRRPERAEVHPPGQLADQGAPLGRRQARIGQRPDQGIPVQGDIPCPRRLGLLARCGHQRSPTLPRSPTAGSHHGPAAGPGHRCGDVLIHDPPTLGGTDPSSQPPEQAATISAADTVSTA